MAAILGDQLAAADDLRPRAKGSRWEREDDIVLDGLWRISRTAVGSSRYKRALWASAEYAKLQPAISSTNAYKRLERLGLS